MHIPSFVYPGQVSADDDAGERGAPRSGIPPPPDVQYRTGVHTWHGKQERIDRRIRIHTWSVVLIDHVGRNGKVQCCGAR